MKTKLWITLFCYILILPFCAFTKQVEAKQVTLQYDAVVDNNYNGADGTQINKLKTYKTIQIALQDAPASLTHPYVIYIKNGRY